jgi:DNA-binding transcriptional ArsR family regulator
MAAQPNAGPGGPPDPAPGDQGLVRALGHPLRRRILRALHAAGDARSPRQLGEAFGLPVARLTYHFAVLSEADAVALASRRRVGGSVEHLYVSQLAEDASAVNLLASTEEEDGAR